MSTATIRLLRSARVLGCWLFIVVGLSASSLAAPAQGLTAQQAATFVGSDGDWFNPANWSTGRVPDAGTDVRIEGRAQVVIDPSRGGPEVAVRDLFVGGDARLTTLAGTILRTRNEVLGDRGQINHESTESYGETLVVAPPTDAARCQGCGFVFNPTPQSIRIVNLQSRTWTVDMGLGGTAAAAPGRVGRGHYANLTADVAVLDGRLRTSLLYGFTPSVGDTFQILTVNQVLLGQFQGLPEGAVVATYGDVALRISYVGGDGNDVVLAAVAKSPAPGA